MSKVRRISEDDAELVALIMRFRKEHGDKPFETGYVASWAIKKKLWTAPPRSLIRELKKELSRVAKAARHVDPQRRRVRTMHAAKIMCALSDGKVIQKVLWDHLDTMSLDHAELSFRQRIDHISGSCVSVNRDKDSFNDNNPNAVGNEIQLSFNFDAIVEKASSKAQEVYEIPLPDLAKGDSNAPELPS